MSQTTPNAHVHPVLRDILNTLAACPQQAALHADFSAVAARVKEQHAAKRAALPPLPAMKLETREEKVARLQAELAAAQAGFDPNYAYSDDHTFWSEQSAKARTIAHCRQSLKAMGAL